MSDNVSKQKDYMKQWALMMSQNGVIESERSLKLHKVANARELGGLVMSNGKRIKHNKLLRTAHLGDASKEDVQYLHDVLHLSLVIDLRGKIEHETSPDVCVPDANIVWIDLATSQIDQMVTKTDQLPDGKNSMEENMMKFFNYPLLQKFMQNFYISLLEDDNAKKQLSLTLNTILDQEGKTVLWHCTQGKDRCGLVSALVLSALGADTKTILDDFSLSNNAYQALLDHYEQAMLQANMDQIAIDTMYATIGVNVNSMKLALEFIDSKYGSLQHYLTDALDFSLEKINLLKDYYLE